MRGDPQAVSARLRAVVPARRWSARVEQVKQRRRERRLERAEMIVRLGAEEPRPQRASRPERAA
ncbi:MAG: hypothetical protein ACLP4R_11420 [Solirubrobacteraceae bacterium]